MIENNRLDKDPNALYQVLFANGVEATTAPGGTWEFEVIGSLGSIRVRNNGDDLQLRKVKSEKERIFLDAPTPAVEAHSTTQSCLEDILDAYETGRPTLGNIQITHHLTEACLAVAESHRQQRRITLPLENRSLYIFHV